MFETFTLINVAKEDSFKNIQPTEKRLPDFLKWLGMTKKKKRLFILACF